ncbi:MAG: hypothetical protein QOF13_1293 [Solirubrobacterales bacterium]|jgi:hypothetical protein|nr:hypothetical protein [Solirubrobacterales bacterium]
MMLMALLVVTFVGGCGSSDGSGALAEVDFGKPTFASCLRVNGASFAESTDDLAFFSKAEAEDTASKFGFTADESAKLLIQLYEDGEDPRVWLLWTGQPLGEQKSPLEIVEAAPSKGYVAYVLHPSVAQRHAIKGCTS